MKKQYPYKNSKNELLIMTLASGSATVFFIYMAFSKNHGLVIGRILKIDPPQSNYAYGFLALMFAILMIFMARLLIKFLTSPQKYLVLNDNYFTAPRDFVSEKIFTVKYQDITFLGLKNINDTRILRIEFPKGDVVVSEKTFSSEDFMEIVTTFKNKATVPLT